MEVWYDPGGKNASKTYFLEEDHKVRGREKGK